MLEPKWVQTEKMMLSCLLVMAGENRQNDYSSANWALWQIERLKKRLDEQGAETDQLEVNLKDCEAAAAEHNEYDDHSW